MHFQQTSMSLRLQVVPHPPKHSLFTSRP